MSTAKKKRCDFSTTLFSCGFDYQALISMSNIFQTHPISSLHQTKKPKKKKELNNKTCNEKIGFFKNQYDFWQPNQKKTNTRES